MAGANLHQPLLEIPEEKGEADIPMKHEVSGEGYDTARSAGL